MRARVALLLALVATASLACPAKADGVEPASTADAPDTPGKPRAFTLGQQPAWYLLAGLTTGGTAVARDRGGYLGGEASIVRLSRGPSFSGFYADAYHDLGAGRTYVTSGIEGGAKYLGIDGGLATRFGGDRPEWGATARIFASIGLVSVYGRYAYFADALGRDDEHVVQVGVLVKFPFRVWGLQ